MKVGVLGSRGIPNHYGGFEQFAEYLSVGLAEKGHDVWVYNSHTHPYKKPEYKNVHIIHCYDAENKIGTAGQFLYDLNCICDSRTRGFDILLQLGYTSSSIWGWLLPFKATVVTNMDGLEWKRSKYTAPVRAFLKHAEKWALLSSDVLVADSVGIQEYLKTKYAVFSEFIPYGAIPYNAPESPSRLAQMSLIEYGYDMLIARLEPENSIEIILEGVANSNSGLPILVIGNHDTAYGRFLKQQFKDPRIRFVGSIYDIDLLNELRFFSNCYFHGHTVGGTNPSLLEAMASGALICAHNNIFNQTILNDDGFYFSNANEVSKIRDAINMRKANTTFIHNNRKKIDTIYYWPNIVNRYEALFFRSLNSNKG